MQVSAPHVTLRVHVGISIIIVKITCIISRPRPVIIVSYSFVEPRTADICKCEQDYRCYPPALPALHRDFGVPYKTHGSIVDALSHTIKHLSEMGLPPQIEEKKGE